MFQHLKNAIRNSSERARDRRTYRALLEANDAILRDIGIPRDEVRSRLGLSNR